MESGAAPDPDVISKGEFAKRRNVTPGRVSQWISEGKITGLALVGEGRSARIRESVAVAQLNQKLDVIQRFGNGLTTRLDPPKPPAAPAPPSSSAAAPDPAIPTLPLDAAPDFPRADPIEEHIKRERLEQLRRANRKSAEEEAVRAGTLVNAETVSQQFGKLAVQIVTLVDGALAGMAASVSAHTKTPQRDILHLLRADFRKVRADAAAAVRRMAGDLPGTIEQDLAGPEEATDET